MDTTTAIAKLEAAIDQQLLLAGGDEAVVSAGEVVLSALRPAVSALALDLCQQAAAEIGAQLRDHTVEVVMRDGEPMLQVREPETQVPAADPDELEARLTLRLPESVKRLVEEEASATGDSINSWVVRTLASRARTREPTSRGPSGSTSGEFVT
ncbi:MAG: hypothetical protein R3320_09455 [Nitriliruptorales bacterium]|nr:hypothetical protein [Nitriliruptorales bacterium]